MTFCSSIKLLALPSLAVVCSKLAMETSKPVENNYLKVPFPTSTLPLMGHLSNWFTYPEKEWTGPFTFVQGTDPQLGLIEKYIVKKENPRWDAEIFLVNNFIEKVNALTPLPRFVVITGDMLDTDPTSPDRMKEHKEQYTDFASCFRKLNPQIGLVCVPGNHDVGDYPTKDTIDLYRQEFGPDFFTFWVGGVQFSVLNTQYYKIKADKEHEDIKDCMERHQQFVNGLKYYTAPVHSGNRSKLFLF